SLSAQDYCERAVAWLKSVQKPDGSFGESLRSYHVISSKGQGNSTPSQTAWGLIGLLAAADPGDASVSKAAEYLVAQQNEDGSWNEQDFTGTGFPCVFYLKYHLYRNSFPVYALARFHNAARFQNAVRDREALNQSRQAEEFCAFKFRPEEFRQRSGF